MRRFLSLEDRLKIEEGRKGGLSYSEIARQLGRCTTVVYEEVQKNSQNGVYSGRCAQDISTIRRLGAGSNRRRVLSDEEKSFIKENFKKGNSITFLRRSLKTYQGTIISVLLKEGLFNNPPKEGLLESRIESLEQQIDIILDKIKEIESYAKNK